MSKTRTAKLCTHLLCLLPLTVLMLRFFYQALGANPVEFITHSTGIWALVILLASLTITPLRKIKALNWMISLRKMLGLYAFFYAGLHFLIYLLFDLNFDFSAVGQDIAKRPFITIGFAAFVLLVPLALTSNQFSIRHLTGKRWTVLHRLVYPAAILVIVHFYWLVKSDVRQPLIYAMILAMLFGIRLWHKFRQR